MAKFELRHSEFLECERNPFVLRALADWWDVQILEADSVGVPFEGMTKRRDELFAEASRIEAGVSRNG